MKKIFLTILGLTLVFYNLTANAEEIKVQEKKSLNLSIQESIEMALKSNLDINLESYNPEIQAFNVQKIRDDFGLYVGFEPEVRSNRQPTSNSFISGSAVLDQFFQTYNFYLKKRFESGGELLVRFDNGISSTNSNRVDFNPAFAPGLSLNFNQPILRTAFNGTKRILIGENQTKISITNLKAKIIEIIALTKATYWDLVAAKLRLSVFENSLKLSEQLLKFNQERLKAGFASKLDLINAETNIATRQESIYQTKQNLEDSEDRLKRLINPDDKLFQKWEFNIKTTDNPQILKFETNIDKSLEKALNRPDYQITLIDKKNIELQKEINEQNRLPLLNLTSAAGLQSLDKTYTSSMGQLFSFKGYFWTVGLNFEFPIQGNLGETEYRQSLVSEKKQDVVLLNLKQKIYNEVRTSVRAVEINRKRIDSNTYAKKLSKEQLDAETEKLKAGFSTSFQVLQFQRDFEQAGLNEVNSIIDYLKSINTLEQIEGSSIENNNMKID